MKFYFGSNHASHDVEGKREWAEFLSTLPTRTERHLIVDSPAQADVVIHGLSDRLDLGFHAPLARPLSRHDVLRVAWDWSDKPTGRHSGFYASLDASYLDPRRHRTMCYPIVYNEQVDVAPPGDAEFSYGFMGGMTHRLRRRLLATLAPRQSADNALVKWRENDWSALHDRSGLPHKQEFADFLRRTKFVLCPRGIGVGTARFYETLKAGRVPVLISDDFVLPSLIDWSSCLLRVRESEIHLIPQIVEAAMPRWPAMAVRARQVWEENFAPGTCLDYLAANLADMEQVGQVTPVMQAHFMSNVARRSLAHHLKPYAGKMRKLFSRSA